MINYKDLIEQYCDEQNFSSKQRDFLMKPIVYEKDLFNMVPLEYMNLIIDMCGKSQNPQYLKENRSYLSNFFTWCTEKDIIKFNPFEEKYSFSVLKYNKILHEMINRMNINVIYEDDIPFYISRTNDEVGLSDIVLRMYYEGHITKMKDLASMKVSDVNFQDKTVKINNRIRNCSDELMNALMLHDKTHSYIINSKKWYHLRYKDYFIKASYMVETPPEISDKNHISNTSFRLSRRLMSMNITKNDVLKSAIVNRLRKELSYKSDREFCNIFLRRKKLNSDDASINHLKELTQKDLNRIQAVIEYMGLGESRTNEVLDSCIPYVVKSKYYTYR